MYTFINLTPHTIVISANDGELVVPPSGHIARVSSVSEFIGDINGIPLYSDVFGEVEGLPPHNDGEIFIVSGLVLTHSTLPYLVAPATGPQDNVIRASDGSITAVTRLKCRAE